jgi:hypothetical protein
MDDKSSKDARSQSSKFKDIARDLECDEDETRWDDRLRKLAKARPEKSE